MFVVKIVVVGEVYCREKVGLFNFIYMRRSHFFFFGSRSSINYCLRYNSHSHNSNSLQLGIKQTQD